MCENVVAPWYLIEYFFFAVGYAVESEKSNANALLIIRKQQQPKVGSFIQCVCVCSEMVTICEFNAQFKILNMAQPNTS